MASLGFKTVDDIKRHLAEVHVSPETPLNGSLLEKLDPQSCGMHASLFCLCELYGCLNIYVLNVLSFTAQVHVDSSTATYLA